MSRQAAGSRASTNWGLGAFPDKGGHDLPCYLELDFLNMVPRIVFGAVVFDILAKAAASGSAFKMVG